MKLAGLGLLSFFLFSIIHVAHSGIFDTLLNTAKDIGAGVQHFGDDVIGAFVDTKGKCPHGGCAPPPPPPQYVQAVPPIQTVHALQPIRTIQPIRPVITVSSSGVYPLPYAVRKDDTPPPRL